MKMSFSILPFCGALLAALALRADSTWTGSVNNDISEPGNWSAGLPTSGQANFNAAIDRLTLSQDLTLGSGVAVNYNGTGAIGLDLGSERTLTIGYRTFIKPNAVVTLKSGTYQHTSDRFFVGDNCSDATFVVDGSSSRLIGPETASGNHYLSIGSANGMDSHSNLLRVQNGGYLKGWLMIGRLANGNGRATCGTNTVLVTGEGSRFDGIGTTFVGRQQGMAHLVAESNAVVSLGANVCLGSATTDSARTLAGPANEICVREGGELTVAGELHVGQQSCSNLFEVASDGKATVNGLLSMSTQKDTLTNNMQPFDNVVRVTGEGSLLSLKAGARIGRTETAYGDRLEILDGGRVKLEGSVPYHVGGNRGSHNNRIVVDNGTLDIGTSSVLVGAQSDGNALVVTNGGVVTANQFLYVGCNTDENNPNGGSSNTLEVAAGGTLNLNDQLRLGWFNRSDGTKPCGNTLWIHGANAKFVTTRQLLFDRFDGQLGSRLLVEDGGLCECRDSVKLPFTQREGGFSSNVEMRVTGTGSRFEITSVNDFVIASNEGAASTNVDARVTVANGGTFSLNGGSCYVGYGGSGAEGIVCERNELHIGSDGTFRQTTCAPGSTSSAGFHLGCSRAAKHNLVRVEGDFALVNTGTLNNAFFVGYAGSSNRFEVLKDGQVLVDKGSMFVGSETTARDNTLVVGAGGKLVLTNSEYAIVGNRGARSSLVVDGGRIVSLGCSRLVVGSQTSSEGSSFSLVNGGVADLRRLVLGDQAPDCSAVVSNATLNLIYDANLVNLSPGYLDIGYSEGSANPAHATLVVAGRNAKVNVGGGIRMRNATAQIRFVIPADGFAETPLVCQDGFVTVTAGASIHVSAAAAFPAGRKVTLIETANTGAIGNLTLTCDADLRVRRVGNTIVAHKPAGITLLIR